MNVKVIRAYKDLELGRMTVPGETLEVSPERAARLLKMEYAKKIKEKEPLSWENPSASKVTD